MRLMLLSQICTKQSVGDGCPFCPTRDFCMKMAKAGRLLQELSGQMPLYWMAEDVAKAKEVDDIFKELSKFTREGRWISIGNGELQCDNKTCHYTTMQPTMYCPCCGNKMEV